MCACAVVCFATFAFKMARDCKGNRRGRCLVCIECREFTPWAKNIRCAYCDCPPTKHESFPIHETTQREGTVTESFTENESGQDHRHDGENKLPNFEDNANQEFQATLINEDDVPSFARGIKLLLFKGFSQFTFIFLSSGLFCRIPNPRPVVEKGKGEGRRLAQ